MDVMCVIFGNAERKNAEIVAKKSQKVAQVVLRRRLPWRGGYAFWVLPKVENIEWISKRVPENAKDQARRRF